MSGDISLAISINRNNELHSRLSRVHMGFTVGRTIDGVKVTLYDKNTAEVIRVYTDPVAFLSEISNYIDLPIEICDYIHDRVAW